MKDVLKMLNQEIEIYYFAYICTAVIVFCICFCKQTPTKVLCLFCIVCCVQVNKCACIIVMIKELCLCMCAMTGSTL